MQRPVRHRLANHRRHPSTREIPRLASSVLHRGLGFDDEPLARCRAGLTINAMKRKDGECILFAEDDGAQKVNMFRWRPEARR